MELLYTSFDDSDSDTHVNTTSKEEDQDCISVATKDLFSTWGRETTCTEGEERQMSTHEARSAQECVRAGLPSIAPRLWTQEELRLGFCFAPCSTRGHCCSRSHDGCSHNESDIL